MSGRLGRLFRRYAARHLALSRPGPVLTGPAGRRIGRVERIRIANDRLIVEGRAAADSVSLDLGGRRRSQTPEPRAGGAPVFRLDLPFVPGVPRLGLVAGDWRGEIALPAIGPLRRALATAALLPGFVLRAARALPGAIAWFRWRDMAGREQVRRALGLGPLTGDLTLDPAQVPGDLPRGEDPARDRAGPAGFSLVLPVYEGFDLLPEVLDRVARHTDLPCRLWIVEDASPDPRIRPFLRAWVEGRAGGGALRVTLIENPANLGFIGSVNAALAAARAAAPDDPVVLLNADAFVPAGWASRLLAPLADPAVASVTPMSNEAELMSVPVICAPTALRPGEGDAIDAVARRIGGPLPAAPTGVGFCMALSPRFLARLPGFDPAFGRGYGEEVDWCQKTAAMGGRHLCLPGLFVEHRGGASFGTAAKRALLAANGALVSARHPRFDAEVQRFIGDDPLVTARLALGLAWAAARAAGGAGPGDDDGGAAVPVYLGHALGGGAEQDLARRVAADVAAQGAAVVIRVGGPWRWQVELHAAAGVTQAGTGDTALLMRLMALLPRRRVVYSCGVGDPDPLTLPALLLKLGAGQRIEVLVHDYFPLSPSYTLLDADGVFRGLPALDTADPAHAVRRPDGSRADLAAWRGEWGRLMAAAEITVFSAASRDLVAAAWPGVADRIAVRPHALLSGVPRLPPPPAGARPVIGVLGNLGRHKGVAVVAALARALARGEGQAGLVILGNVDPAWRIPRPARVHGSYVRDDLPALVRRYGITHWLIPSVWPETFSFTTHEALATGLPVIAFGMGAQGEAVARALAAGASGAVLPPPADPRAGAAAVLAALAAA